ncbi:MAG: tRNA pseudouridine(55) synthase TruB [Acidimicrobiales bacterium]|nr:tRNA pseudouridine(55) synthase TruB [Acidimicrobiales bacterium]RZV43273.1 MAG: tRNA pseudouridine(55) synthase TruB [Acidimicrobiales bacterium]
MGRKQRREGPTGFAIVDKAPGFTSHDVVAKARGIFGTRKVGHSGTLDPDATGVLLLGVGRATRLLRFLDGAQKSYVGEIVLGVETDTLDAAGETIATHDMDGVTLAEVVAASKSFVGDIMQVPPMVSAIKIDGKRLHQLAREGIEVERPPRPVTIHSLEIAPTDEPLVFRATVSCSSGTYIRSLAADIGSALGGGAHLRNLRRTAIGSFAESEAHPIDDAVLLPAAVAVRDLAPVTVDDKTADDIRYGRVLDRERIGLTGDGPYPLLDDSGELLAVYEPHKANTVKPAIVLAQPLPKQEADPS